MSFEDENIRRIAQSINAQNQAERLSKTAFEQSMANDAMLRRQEDQVNAIQVRNLCGRFAVWASSNGISYNSPSVLAPGWLLGHYEGEPGGSNSSYGTYTSWSSDVSLLVKSSGNIRELVVHSTSKKTGGRQYHIFSRNAKLERVPIESIHNSIAQFSVKNNVNWK